MGEYAKFQIIYGYYTLTIRIRVQEETIWYFVIFENHQILRKNRLLMPGYCSPYPKQCIAIFRSETTAKIFEPMKKRGAMQALFVVLRRKPTRQPVLFVCSLSLSTFGTIIM